MSFVRWEPASNNGVTNTWLTPLSLIEKLGEFDLDPCAYPDHRTAKNLNCLPSDGLQITWEGRVFLNPPYGGGSVGKWLAKLADHGNGVALVFVRTDTKWFQFAAQRCDWMFFLSKRIRFEKPGLGPAPRQAGVPSVLIGFGQLPDLSRLDGFLCKVLK